MIPITETQLVGWAIEYLLRKGHFVWRNNTGARPWKDREGNDRMMRFGKVGSADILGIHKADGKLIAVECKVGKGKLRPEQKEFLDEVERRGGYAHVIYTPEDLMRVL